MCEVRVVAAHIDVVAQTQAKSETFGGQPLILNEETYQVAPRFDVARPET